MLDRAQGLERAGIAYKTQQVDEQRIASEPPLPDTVVEVVGVGVVTISFICRVGVSNSAVCKHAHTYNHTRTRTHMHEHTYTHTSIHTYTA